MNQSIWLRPAAVQEPGDDVGFLALALFSLLGKLVKRGGGVLKEEDLAEQLAGVDRVDGVAEGFLLPDALRSALGLVPSALPKGKLPKPASPKPIRRRRR